MSTTENGISVFKTTELVVKIAILRNIVNHIPVVVIQQVERMGMVYASRSSKSAENLLK